VTLRRPKTLVSNSAGLGVGDLLDCAEQPVAGVVDQHVDPPEAADARRHGRRGLLLISDVEPLGQPRVARPGQCVGDLLRVPGGTSG
jgi:hypothetical protein